MSLDDGWWLEILTNDERQMFDATASHITGTGYYMRMKPGGTGIGYGCDTRLKPEQIASSLVIAKRACSKGQVFPCARRCNPIANATPLWSEPRVSIS
jgi:hypothetical protein